MFATIGGGRGGEAGEQVCANLKLQVCSCLICGDAGFGVLSGYVLNVYNFSLACSVQVWCRCVLAHFMGRENYAWLYGTSLWTLVHAGVIWSSHAGLAVALCPPTGMGIHRCTLCTVHV